MNRLALLAVIFAVAMLTGCPKQTTTTVAGSEDEMVDQLSAQLEELRTCDIAAKSPDRNDFQK